MPDSTGRKLISDMQDSARSKGRNTSAGRSQMRAVEKTARGLSKQAASKSVRATAATAASKAAKLAKLTRVTPVGLVAGALAEKGGTVAANYARKKFVEYDTKKMSRINKRSKELDQLMGAARDKNKKNK